jgi:hypothetical protein
VRGDVTEFGTCPELLEVVVKRMRSIEHSDFGAMAEVLARAATRWL